MAGCGALLLSLAASSADNAILRIAKTPPRPTLDAIVLPPGAEIMLIRRRSMVPMTSATRARRP